MLASVNLTLDNAELPNLELLAAEIQNGKMELALSVNPADSSVTLAITSVVYDTQAYVPSSVEVAVTVEYVFHTNLSTPSPAYEPYYEKVQKRMVSLSHVVDSYLLSSGVALERITILFYCANEAISILENAGKIGVPLPEKLLTHLNSFKEKNS